MQGIVIGLIVIALVPVVFLICPGENYSCQVVRSVNLVFGMMALALSGTIVVVEWRNRRKGK